LTHNPRRNDPSIWYSVQTDWLSRQQTCHDAPMSAPHGFYTPIPYQWKVPNYQDIEWLCISGFNSQQLPNEIYQPWQLKPNPLLNASSYAALSQKATNSTHLLNILRFPTNLLVAMYLLSHFQKSVSKVILPFVIVQLCRAWCCCARDAICFVNGIDGAAGAKEIQVSVCWVLLVG
jgi:hypothetical protein